jgi:hypothetical protein
MKSELNRQLEDRKMDSLLAVVLQLELEDEKRTEWRERARKGEVSPRAYKLPFAKSRWY